MTKRILQTGFTGQHTGSVPRLKYDPVAKLYKDMLEYAGYEVDNRPVTFDDTDVSSYDALFFGLSSMNSFTARWQYTGLAALQNAHEAGVPVVYYIDDWKSHGIVGGAKGVAEKPTRFAQVLFGKDAKKADELAWVHANQDKIVSAASRLANEQWGTLVMPVYRDGDWHKFDEKFPDYKQMVGIDPTAFYTPYDTVIPEDSDREKSWVFGILSDQRKWLDKLNLEWPLAHRGSRASKAEDGGMPEPELVQMYADSWGVLSCPYWHSGSGWFRIRHEHAMGTRSVLYSEGELSFISDAFDVSVAEVEAMNSTQLRNLADAQSYAWYSQKMSKVEAATLLRDTVEAEIAEHR